MCLAALHVLESKHFILPELAIICLRFYKHILKPDSITCVVNTNVTYISQIHITILFQDALCVLMCLVLFVLMGIM